MVKVYTLLPEEEVATSTGLTPVFADTTLETDEEVAVYIPGVTITLSASPSTNTIHRVYNFSSGIIYLDGNGSDTIRSSSSTFELVSNSFCIAVYGGSTWEINQVKTERTFTYIGDTPTNGINVLGNTNNFNIFSKNIIFYLKKENLEPTVTASSTASGNPNDLIDHSNSIFNTDNINNSWVKLDFGTNITINPTTVIWQHGNINGTYRMQTYIIQGSNNDSTWDNLLDVNNSPPANAAYTYKVDTVSTTSYYRYLRILQNGLTTNGDNRIRLSELTVFGNVKGL